MLCVFDIETIPDVALLQTNGAYCGSSLEIIESAFKEQLEKSGSSFLPLPFHRVIAIACVMCDDFGRFKKVGHFGKEFIKKLESSECQTQIQGILPAIDDDTKKLDLNSLFFDSVFLDSLESTLLAEFWEFFNKNQPRLVSFNGRGFDLPVLLLRAMRYNLNAYSFFESNNEANNKTKWENYKTRYAERFHTDLLDSLGHFGITKALNLNSLCQMLGIVGKYDISGEQVHKIYYSQDSNILDSLLTINHYCHSDVLNTYWLYLKYLLLKGEILENDYADLLAIFKENLPQDKPYSEIFSSSLSKHIEQLRF